MPDRKNITLGIMQDYIFFFRSFAVWKSVRNTAGFLGILPPLHLKMVMGRLGAPLPPTLSQLMTWAVSLLTGLSGAVVE